MGTLSIHLLSRGCFWSEILSSDQFVKGVADDNLSPLTCQLDPIGRLGEQKYGIWNTENMESEGGKICKWETGEGSNCAVSWLPLVKLNKVKADQVWLTKIRKDEKVTELTLSSSQQHFI